MSYMNEKKNVDYYFGVYGTKFPKIKTNNICDRYFLDHTKGFSSKKKYFFVREKVNCEFYEIREVSNR